jgi:hypothetical protein
VSEPTSDDAAPAPAPAPAIDLDQLLLRTQRFVSTTVTRTVEEPLRDVGRWAERGVLYFTLALTCLITAIGFLGYGFMRLLTEWLPLYGACLIVGGVSLVLGLIFLRR